MITAPEIVNGVFSWRVLVESIAEVADDQTSEARALPRDLKALNRGVS